MGFFSGLFPAAFRQLVVIDKWRSEKRGSERARKECRAKEG